MGKAGRPKEIAFTFDEAMAVMDELAYTPRTLSRILETPYRLRVFNKFVNSDAKLSQALAHARSIKAHVLIDESYEIGENELDPRKAHINIELRKWTAGKLLYQVYGDRVDVNVTQTVDIKSTLEAAQARRLLPTRYPEQSAIEQVTESKQIEDASLTGTQPVNPASDPENDTPKPKPYDPFD